MPVSKEKQKAYHAEWYRKKRLEDPTYGNRKYVKDDFYTTYYLPEHHYAGVTRCFTRRMAGHRRDGRSTDGVIRLAHWKTLEEARHHENLMHSWMGCNGIHLSE